MGKPQNTGEEAPCANQKGLGFQLGQLKRGLQNRLSRVLEVIDDALNSEHLKDRIWAVEQLLKRLIPGNTVAGNPATAKKTTPNPTQLASLSDEALTRRIQSYIRAYQKKYPSTALSQADLEAVVPEDDDA